jgi:hypothetical protein
MSYIGPIAASTRAERLQHLDKIVSSDPTADDRVNFLDMPDPVKIGLETRIVSRAGTTGQVEYVSDNARRDPAAVARVIRAARRLLQP